MPAKIKELWLKTDSITSRLLRTTGSISSWAHIRADMPSVVTALCAKHSLCLRLLSAVKCLTGPAPGDSFLVTSSERSHLWEVISVNGAVVWDLGKNEVSKAAAEVPH